MKFMQANRIAPDDPGTLCFAALQMGLFCLPMSHKKASGLYGLSCTLILKYFKSLKIENDVIENL